MKEAIYTDKQRVETIKNVCSYAQTTMQSIYDELVKTGCEFTAREILDIWQMQADEDYIKGMIVKKKLETDPPVMFGMKLSENKLSQMIEVDNMAEILATYKKKQLYINNDSAATVGYADKFLSIIDGVVSLAVDYETTIADDCTLFVTTLEQQEKVTKLVNIAEALNGLDGVLLPGWRGEIEIEGLKEVNKKYVPDMKQIAHIMKR